MYFEYNKYIFIIFNKIFFVHVLRDMKKNYVANWLINYVGVDNGDKINRGNSLSSLL